jgi:hypothetical protein
MQVNLFGVVNIVAEFIGSGIQPYVRIDILTLTRLNDFAGTVTTVAEVSFFSFFTFRRVYRTKTPCRISPIDSFRNKKVFVIWQKLLLSQI